MSLAEMTVGYKEKVLKSAKKIHPVSKRPKPPVDTPDALWYVAPCSVRPKINSSSPTQALSAYGRAKAISYVQPSTLDMLAGASPASAIDGWAE